MKFTLYHRLLEPESPTPVHRWRAITSDDHGFLVDHIAEDAGRREAWRIVTETAKPTLWAGGGGRAVPILAPDWRGTSLADSRREWAAMHDWLSAWTYCQRADWMLDGLADAAPSLRRREIARAAEAIVRPHLHHQPAGSKLAQQMLDAALANIDTAQPSDAFRQIMGRCSALADKLARVDVGAPSKTPVERRAAAVVRAAVYVGRAVESSRWASLAASSIQSEFPAPQVGPGAGRDADIVRQFLTPDAVYMLLADMATGGVSR